MRGICMKNGKLYNIFFPIWFLLVFPISWLVVLPVNFIIDTFIVICTLKFLGIINIKKIYKKVILKVWLIGFFADILGCTLLFLKNDIPNSLYNSVKNKVVWNPFINTQTVILILSSILISIFFLYYLNLKVSFKNIDIEKKNKEKLAAVLAIITAPWILLFPIHLIYNNNLSIVPNNININGNNNLNIIKQNKDKEIIEVLNELDFNKYIENGVYDNVDLKLSVNYNSNLKDNISVEEYNKIFGPKVITTTLSKNADKIFKEISYINDVDFKVSNDKTYNYSRN